jgi:hypothetical protein
MGEIHSGVLGPMPRGYRCIVIACFGWLTLVASSPRDAAQGKQQAEAHEIAQELHQLNTTIKEAGETGSLNQACQNKASDRESQLCAQWQSADAGKASAIWTERTFWIGIGGTVVGLLALIAAGLAAKFAKDAVNETRRIGEVQSRAYLSISNVEGYRTKNGLGFKITLQNAGQSPAIEVGAYCKVIMKDGSIKSIPMHRRNDSVPANSIKALPYVYYVDPDAKRWTGIVIQIGIGYADVFGNIFSFHTDYAGNPDQWLSSKPSELVEGSHIVSVLDAGIVEADD